MPVGDPEISVTAVESAAIECDGSQPGRVSINGDVVARAIVDILKGAQRGDLFTIPGVEKTWGWTTIPHHETQCSGWLCDIDGI